MDIKILIISFLFVCFSNSQSCMIDSLHVDIENCSFSNTLSQDIVGTVFFSNSPLTGELIVEDCYGQRRIFTPPFNDSVNFSYNIWPLNGIDCEIKAFFSDEITCSDSILYISPSIVDSFTTNCTFGAGSINGEVFFTNPHNGEFLIIEATDGTSTVYDSILLPVASPYSWNVSGLDPSVNPYIIKYYFSDNQICNSSLSLNCGCSADGGSMSISQVGQGINNYQLCYNDYFTLTSNNDYSFPDDIGSLGGIYNHQPEFVTLVFTCPPTIGLFMAYDPCYVGYIANDTVINVNNTNSLAQAVGSQDLYFAPSVAYHYDPSTPIIVFNENCWDYGPVIHISYLDDYSDTSFASCSEDQVEFIVNGSLPAYDNSSYTISNITPNNIASSNTLINLNDTIIFTNINNNDIISFDVTDQNGCQKTVNLNSYVKPPNANAGINDTSCSLTHNLNAIPSFGAGQWGVQPNVVFDDINDPNTNVSVSTEGVYQFIWTEVNVNCSDSDTVEILFSPIEFSTNTINSVCNSSNGEVEFNQLSLSNLSYKIDSQLNYSPNPIFDNLSSGTYIFNIIDQNNCVVNDTLEVFDIPTTLIDSVKISNELCFDDQTGSITIFSNSLTNTYSIDSANSFFNSNVFNNLSNGTYNVFVKDTNNCLDSNIVYINPGQNPRISFPDTLIVCRNETVNLAPQVISTIPIEEYIWSNNEVDSLITLNITSNSTICVNVKDTNQCESNDECLYISIYPDLEIIISPNDTICIGDSSEISVQASNGAGLPYSYNWNLDLNQSPNGFVSPNITTTYIVEVTDNCLTYVAIDSVEIVIIPEQIPEIFASDTIGCIPLNVTLSSNILSSQICEWKIDNQFTSNNCSNFNLSLNQIGCVDIEFSTIDNYGCQSTVLEEDFICVIDNPIPDFSFYPSEISDINPSVSFINESQFEDSITWIFISDTDSSFLMSNPAPKYDFPTDKENYLVCIEAKNILSCQSLVCKEIEKKDIINIYVPNSFSPSPNDNVNNEFGPVISNNSFSKYIFEIFNSNGELIFSSSDINELWDGTHRGLDCELDVYVWKLSLVTKSRQKVEKYGHVTLLR